METTWHEGYAAVGGGRLHNYPTGGHGDALGVVCSWCACCSLTDDHLYTYESFRLADDEMFWCIGKNQSHKW
jgi:hypothetical protein